MPLSITIKLSGDQQELQRMKGLSESLTDFTPVMQSIGKALTSYYSNQVFASQGGVYGEPWAPLSAVTLYMRGAGNTQLTAREAGFVAFLHNKRGQAGTLTGLRAGIPLRAPLTTGHPGGMQFSFSALATANSVVIGNTKPYFKYHQSTEPRRRLPRRQMLGINDDVISMVQQLVRAEVNAKIEATKS
jgi:phage gpG-like protein